MGGLGVLPRATGSDFPGGVRGAVTEAPKLVLLNLLRSDTMPRHDYEEIIDALEGGEDAGAESDAGEDYDLAG